MSLALNVTYDNTDSLFQYSNISNRPIGDWVRSDSSLQMWLSWLIDFDDTQGLSRHEDYQ